LRYIFYEEAALKLKTKEIVIIPLFTALMVAGAKIIIPFPLVPITFQLFFCIYAGLLIGKRNAVLSQFLYVTIGLLGLPVFSQGGGFQYIMNPTFGYILGFVLCAWVVAALKERMQAVAFSKLLLICLMGLLAVYALGNSYFYVIYNLHLEKTLSFSAICIMMLPYMLKDSALAGIAAYTAKIIIPRIRAFELG